MDVGISVDAMEYYGKPYSRLFEVSVTNVLASGEFRVFPFTLEAGWCPTNPPPFDTIRFFACVFKLIDKDFSVNCKPRSPVVLQKQRVFLRVAGYYIAPEYC